MATIIIPNEINNLNGEIAATKSLIGRKNMDNIATADGEVTNGYLQYYWNRTGTPATAYNYSPLIFFKPSTQESSIVMFCRGTGNLVTKHKVNDTWGEWSFHDSREAISSNQEYGTASRTYEKGEYLFFNEYLYIAKVAIPQGTALSSSNLLSVRVTEHLKQLEDYSVQSIGGTYFRAIRKGPVVNFSAAVGYWTYDSSSSYLTWCNTSNGTYTTPQLSEEMRPPFNVELIDALAGKRVTIMTDGHIGGATDISVTPLRFTACWLANNSL